MSSLGAEQLLFLSTDLLSSTGDFAFFTIVRCETASRLSLEGLVVHLLQAVRQEPSEQREYCAFLCRIGWFGYGSDKNLRNCKSSAFGRIGDAFAERSKTKVF